MNFKEINNLTDLFDKLNARKEVERNSESLSPEEIKIKYFWENSMPSEIDSSSIKNKTLQKIKLNHSRHIRRLYWLIPSSAAAVLLIFLSVAFFMRMYQNNSSKFRDMAAQMNNTSIKDVTLVTSNKQMNLKNDAFIKYTKNGDIAVDSCNVKDNDTPDEEYNRLIVPAGKRARIELSDGSHLIVNSLSKVIYPRCFYGDKRRIYAEGEVYLDVAHDAKHPFMVISKDFELQVLGTQFNISTYNSSKTNIVLVRGSVSVTDSHSHKATLTPNDMLSLTNGSISGKEKVDVSAYISWINGILLLKGDDLSNVIHKLSIYYDVPISYSPEIAHKKIYGQLDLKDNIEDVIECISQTMPIKIEKKNSSIYLTELINPIKP